MKKGDKIRFNELGLKEYGQNYFSGVLSEFTVDYIEVTPFYDIAAVKLKEFPHSGPYPIKCFELVDIPANPKYNKFIENLLTVSERSEE